MQLSPATMHPDSPGLLMTFEGSLGAAAKNHQDAAKQAFEYTLSIPSPVWRPRATSSTCAWAHVDELVP